MTTHDSNHHFAFLSGANFLKAPSLAAKPDSRFAVAGIAWDGCVTNRPGARFGPAEIRRASHMLCDGVHPYFDVSPLDVLCDAGDLALPNTSLESMRHALMPLADRLISQYHMLWLGGDHSITLPLLRAYKKVYGRPLALVHFDAHCDTWTDHFGEPSGHGTWTYEALKEGLVVPEATIQIGIRSSGKVEAREYVNHVGGRVFTARQLRGCHSEDQLAVVANEVRRRVVSTNSSAVYLSFDIDALDPAFAPGTGTPEPGGLTSAQAMTLLELMSDLPFVGMDMVEVAPAYDHAELTTNIAATLAWTYLCGQAKKPR